MKTFIQPGNIISVTAPASGITSGDGIIVGSLFGIAARDALEDESVEIAITGVYGLPKDSGAVIALGDRVAWDDVEKHVTLPGVGLYPIGVATTAAGDGATAVTVRLDGIAIQAA